MTVQLQDTPRTALPDTMPSAMNVTIETPSPRKIPKAPEDRPLPAKNCCTLCMYNIPSGSLMVLLPGLVLLITGVIVMVWTQYDSSWNGDLTTASLIFVIIGGALTLGAIIYWCSMWLKYRPKVTSKHQKVSPRGAQGGVELVGVQRRGNDPQEVYVVPEPDDGISTIS